MTVQFLQGDALEHMRQLDDSSVDAIVTDPPYGLKFMGKNWDQGVPGVVYWKEALRVAKPGAHLLAFGGTRTHHRLMVAIEDAGWEIRDCIFWVYGSGFPKSLDVGKAIDKAAGVEGARGDYKSRDHAIKRKPGNERMHEGYQRPWRDDPKIEDRNARDYFPATEAAKQWDGWGTALKPAVEPIILARKPLDGTVAANVQAHGTGALNIDGCRIGADDGTRNRPACATASVAYAQDTWTKDPASWKGFEAKGKGRFPANLIHDGSDEVMALFPKTTSGKPCGVKKGGQGNAYGEFGGGIPVTGIGDTGSAARFFYCAKASRSDRNIGLDDTCTVKYNIPRKGGVLCKDATMALVASLKKATSEQTGTWYIGESGGSIMGLFQSDTLSTTLTAISRITTSQILSLLTPLLTSAFTQAVNLGMGNGGSRAASVESLSQWIQNTTNGDLALAPGVDLVVSQMLSTISAGANWKPLTNIHSTVKPTDLMRYLCRLITPPGGLILDPFMGSGSTGKAAILEGFRFVGIDLEVEYVEIARRRIEGAEEEAARCRKIEKQLSLFSGNA